MAVSGTATRLGIDPLLSIQAVLAAFCVAGVAMLHRLTGQLGGYSPGIAALTLLLNPHFLAHAGGLGDFAVSLSLLIASFALLRAGSPLAAAAAFALAAGCRLSLAPLLFAAIPLATGTLQLSFREWGRFATLSVLLIGGLYAPLFAMYGTDLFHNFDWNGWRYHGTATAYRLYTALGPAFAVWTLAAAFVLITRRRVVCSELLFPGLVAIIMTAVLFRVPTKPELTLPLSVAGIVLGQTSLPKLFAPALLGATVLSGVINLSPYSPETGVREWTVRPGWYQAHRDEALANRDGSRRVKRVLAQQQAPTLFVARFAPELPDGTSLHAIPLESTLLGRVPADAYTFTDLPHDRFVLHFQSRDLRWVVETAHKRGFHVLYEAGLAGQCRRWFGFDLARFGQPVDLLSHL